MPGMNTRSPRHEPIMMIRPPVFRCLSAACVATKTPRTSTAKTRSKSARVVSSTFIGMTVPALFTSTSSRPSVVTEEDRLVLEEELARLAENEWKYEAELALNIARERGLYQVSSPHA